ncbi:chromosome segregation ATPase domain protein [Burkholderia ubonensis MSMB22]|nr:chromosome segregation ATPase domain protein [Burkholderia ubonensis MSMB22]AJX13977.1 chromosome segregation ATPase domain protein [Burkholderia ubonensis MSMB22]
MPAPITRWLPLKPPLIDAFRFSVIRACMLTAIAFWPRNVDAPTPIPKLASRSSCGIDAIAPTAAIPCFAIWSVCCSCEPRLLICACWPDSAVDIVDDTALSWLTLTASVPCVPGATLTIWRCCVSLPTDTTFERPPSVDAAPIATEFEPAVTVGRSVPVPFMSAETPFVFTVRVVLLFSVVDSWFSVLLMVVTPVDSDATVLFVELRPVDSEPMPVEVDVDSDVRLLLVDDSPVDSELMLVDVDVDSDATVLLVELRPVDSELIPVDSEPMLVDVAVDRLLTAWFVALSWLPLIASVLVAEMRPAATLVIWRSAPGAPTLTTLVGELPAKKYVTPPIVVLDVGFAAAVTEFVPSATSLRLFATAFEPNASEPAPAAVAVLPRASEPLPVAVLALPIASAPLPVAVLFAPSATAPVPVATFGSPIATAPSPLAVFATPIDTALPPVADAFWPMATAPFDEAFAPSPTATLLAPEALAFTPAAIALMPVAPSLL